jgi:hypothetical protein
VPATVTALHGSDYPTATSGDMIATWRSETRKTGDIVCSATAILSCPGEESLGIFVVRAAVFHSFISNLSDDRSTASSKSIPPLNAI